MNITGIALEIITLLVLYWYYHHFMHENSFLKNVIIYAVIEFALEWYVGDITGILSIILVVVTAIINVKILDYIQKNTTSVLTFMLIGEVCLFLTHLIIRFVATGTFSV